MPFPQANATRRRLIVAAIVVMTLIAGFVGLTAVLSADGLSIAEICVLVGFLLTMPYTVIGCWNALIGLWLRHRRRELIAQMPGVAELSGVGPTEDCVNDTAIVMTLRNEPVGPAFERLSKMRDSLAATGQIARFTFVVLSDSDRADVRADEIEAMTRFAAERATGEPVPIHCHRQENTGYKAGNIAAFLDAHGQAFDYFLPLDADSMMGGETIVRMVQAMARHPRIGILQTLVVGMPSASGFTRLFQFGMRHAMRAFTTGAAWWAADCGAYWGHNALIRVAPFSAHCRLPRLSGGPPLGGDILSHDQVEAAFMRRAGYEVRTVPVETESYEVNPPTLLEFIRRELRWCQGNMQYFRLLFLPGLAATSRVQLAMAIGMYIAPVAWIGMTIAACVGAATGDFQLRFLMLGSVLFVAVFVLAIMPKLVGALDVALTSHGCAAYGGRTRFVVSVGCELLSSMIMAPIVALSITLFLGGLLFGRHIAWGGQKREAHGLAWRDALIPLAPHTILGVAVALVFWRGGGLPSLLWALPIVGGLALAVPYTVWSAKPSVGRSMARYRLCQIPEEAVPLTTASIDV